MPGEPPRHTTQPASVTAAVELARRPRFDEWRCCGFRHAIDVHTAAGRGIRVVPGDSPDLRRAGPSNASPAPAQGRYQGPARVVPTAAAAVRPSPWTHDRSRARRDGSGTRLRPTPPAGRRAAGCRARRGCRSHRGGAERRRGGLGGAGRGRAAPEVPARPAAQAARRGVLRARAAVRHGSGDLPDHPRGAVRDGRHRPHLLRLRLALRPVRRRGRERGAQAADRPGGRPGADGRAVRAGRLRGVPDPVEERRGADLRRGPLPASRGRRVLVAAARRPGHRPAVRAGRRRRPAGGPGAARARRVRVLVARADRQGRHPCGRHRLSVGAAGLPGPGHSGGRQHQPGHPLAPPRGPPHPGRPAAQAARPPLDRRLGVPARPAGGRSRHPSDVGGAHPRHQPADRSGLRAHRARPGHSHQRVPGAHGRGVDLPGHRHGGPARRFDGPARRTSPPTGRSRSGGRRRWRTSGRSTSWAPASAPWT